VKWLHGAFTSKKPPVHRVCQVMATEEKDSDCQNYPFGGISDGLRSNRDG
jgi:hypothetical protein